MSRITVACLDMAAPPSATTGPVAGVLTGGSARQELEAVPGTASLPGEVLVLDSIACLPSHLGL